MVDFAFILYSTPQDEYIAQQWQQRLTALRVQTKLHIIDVINAKFLRLHPELSLIVDENGLWLAANGMKMQPA